MSYLSDDEKRKRLEAAELKLAARAGEQQAEDVRAVFESPAARRLFAVFVADSGFDASQYRDNQGAMGHANGWRDACGWWMDRIREHCPEREQQFRNEARERAKQEVKDLEAA